MTIGHHQKFRNKQRRGSNNPRNTNKNVCALEVAKYFNVEDEVRYLHVRTDTKRALMKKYSIRSVKSSMKKTVGGSRAAMTKYAAERSPMGFVIFVDGHVIAMNRNGSTAVDTDPRKNDRRPIEEAYAVYWKN
jgi:hypothetical protein